ncbi:Neurofascin [Trichoplax sp. H2]|nr:Neurofascin [Trichoplax sp. H2]|eukprot:RDD37385.1 Neurofascin [Trichoplax sp. H2]
MRNKLFLIKIWLFILAILLIDLIHCQSSSQKSPTIIFPMLNYVGNNAIDTNASLEFVVPCSVMFGDQRRWLHNGVIVQYNDRIKIKNYALSIEPFQLQDSGTYRCQASNRYGTAISRYAKIEAAKVPVIDSAGVSYQLQPGIAANLNCQLPSSQSPMPSLIYWKQRSTNKIIVEDERITVSAVNGNLYFANTQVSDSNEYQCHVVFTLRHPYRQRDNRNISLNGNWQTVRISGAPFTQTHPFAEILASATHVVEGDYIVLECIVGGYPIPDVAWYKDGRTLEPSNSVAYQLSARSRRLRITEAKSTDSGIYTCITKNRHSTTNTSVTLHIYTEPLWISPPEDTYILEKKRFDWPCLASGIDITYKWFINGKPITNSSRYQSWPNGTLTIHDVKVSDTAIYTCNAETLFENIAQSAYLNVSIRAPVIQYFPHSIIHLNAGDRARIYCNATGGPTPVISFLKDGKPLQDQATDRIELIQGIGLIIQNISLADAGQYGCVAKNRLGTTERYVTIIVYQQTEVKIQPVNIINKKNTNLTLSCSIYKDSRLRINVTWLTAMENHVTKYTISTYQERKNLYISTLSLYQVQVHDSGTYTCIVETFVPTKGIIESTARSEITIKKQDVPDPPYNVHCYSLNTSAIRLEWTAGDSNLAAIKEFNLAVVMTTISSLPRSIMTANVSASINSIDVPVQPYNTYLLFVAATNLYGIGLTTRTECNATIYDIPHLVPSYLRARASSYTADVIYTSWIPIPRIYYNAPGFGYKIVVNRVTPNGLQRVKRSATATVRYGNVSSEIIEGLLPNMIYEVKVISFNDMGDSDVDGETLLVRTGESPPTFVPSNLYIYPIAPTRAWLAWHTNKSMQRYNIQGYKVAYWIESDIQTTSTINAANNATEIIIEDLRPYRNYTFQITSIGNGGVSTLSLTRTRAMTSLVPGPVRSFEIIRNRLGTIEIAWSSPMNTNGPVLNYRIQCTDAVYTDIPPRIVVTSNNGTYLSLPFQFSYGYYIFSIMAKNAIGYGVPITTEKRVIAYGPLPPQNLTALHVSNVSTTLAWTIDSVRYVDGFVLEMKRTQDAAYQYFDTKIGVAQRQITINDLTPGTVYQFIMRSKHEELIGDLHTGELSIQTKSDKDNIRDTNDSTLQIILIASSIGLFCIIITIVIIVIVRQRKKRNQDNHSNFGYVVTIKGKSRRNSIDTIRPPAPITSNEGVILSRLDPSRPTSTLQMPAFYPHLQDSESDLHHGEE